MGTVTTTAFYAGILAIILVVLSVRVVLLARVKAHLPYGDGGKDELMPVIRAQGNFVEYVPLAILLIGYLEFTGSSANLIHGLGIALVLARILHPIGLRAERGPTVARVASTFITWIVLLVAAIAAMVGFLAGGSP